MKTNEEQAILFVMDFYKVSREQACELYRDEINAYMMLNEEENEMTPEDKQSKEFRDWLRGHLRVGPTTITFTKADGSERVMKATTNFDLIPEEFTPKNNEGKVEESVDKEDIDLIKCFDLEANGWRSFKPSKVLKVEFSIGDNA